MLKRAILAGTGILGLIFSITGFATTPDALSLGGAWLCQGYDMHDGAYKDAALTLTLDAQNSDFANNYGAYHFKLADPNGAVYLGEVAASGNTAAIYFANTSPKMSTDRGVGIAVITHDLNSQGKPETVLHKFYYEPTYQGGGNGSEVCVKQRD